MAILTLEVKTSITGLLSIAAQNLKRRLEWTSQATLVL
jgi:hypothetical protein